MPPVTDNSFPKCSRCGAVHLVISFADMNTEKDCAYMDDIDAIVAGILPKILQECGFDSRSVSRTLLQRGAVTLQEWARRYRSPHSGRRLGPPIPPTPPSNLKSKIVFPDKRLRRVSAPSFRVLGDLSPDDARRVRKPHLNFLRTACRSL